MYGAGIAVFAVWGYVIAHARDGRVELNPKKLADTLGGTVEEIEQAIDYLCRPDPQSRHKEHEGRRLIKEGQFQYFAPSWKIYYRIKSEEERREYNRVKQAEHRQRRKQQAQQPSGSRIWTKGAEHGRMDVESISPIQEPSGGLIDPGF